MDWKQIGVKVNGSEVKLGCRESEKGNRRKLREGSKERQGREGRIDSQSSNGVSVKVSKVCRAAALKGMRPVQHMAFT